MSKNQALLEMKVLKALFGKMDGKQHIHFMHSFPEMEGLKPDLVHKIAIEISEYYSDDYQLLIATHTNRPNLHSHFVLNPVNITTGKKYSQSAKQLENFKYYVDEICSKYGLEKETLKRLSQCIEASYNNWEYEWDFDNNHEDELEPLISYVNEFEDASNSEKVFPINNYYLVYNDNKFVITDDFSKALNAESVMGEHGLRTFSTFEEAQASALNVSEIWFPKGSLQPENVGLNEIFIASNLNQLGYKIF